MREWIIDTLSEIISRKAVNPKFGGTGEKERADYIQKLIEEMGFTVERYDVKDEKGYTRSNLVVEVEGEDYPVWVIAHLDTVSPGTGWETDPFKLVVKGDKVFGRGVNDNGIGIMSILILLKRISEGKVKLKHTLKAAFVADEEAGSRYGVVYLIKKGLFKEGEKAIIPDFGSKKGDIIEIAEKGILWLKMITRGKQGHGSMPHKADNAHLKSAKLMLELYESLRRRFYKINRFFDPPYSTFEPTKKEKNVDSINIIPGEDVIYWDCRIIPEYSLEEVIEFFEGIGARYDATFEVVMKEKASFTREDDEIVKKLRNSIRNVLNVEPRLIGIGGGTVAGILRKIGIPSVAWGVNSGTEHKPNEWEMIESYIKTERVIEDVLSK